eukprot:TRINITY_DN2042_c0_g1_i5.p1 TRINITY_DN2042_c0_g1~~TRINITY_DN2042_c0_g1_i5.p1  ORF type:complete len:384 (+),score=68.57 TRINITY_DN2042_c0_g1_i5:169-1152(+)
MASQPKHRRVLTDSSILGYNFGSSSISNFLSVSSLFSYASSAAAYKYLDLMVHAPGFPAKEINTESINVQMQECLESIRISSPTQTDFVSLKDYINLQQTEENIHGNNWLVSVKHPSALDSFEDILGQAHGKQIAVFLDYDGTLSPIVDDPDQAYMSDEMRNALKKVAEHFPTAIITGRCRDKIFEFVQLPELYYAGSHGMDIIGPTQVGNRTNNTMALKEDPVFFQPHNSYLSRMEEVYNLLKERTEFFKGAKIENNKYCIAIHFRCVKEESWSVLVKEVFSILSEFPELRITQGRKVIQTISFLKVQNILTFVLPICNGKAFRYS